MLTIALTMTLVGVRTNCCLTTNPSLANCSFMSNSSTPSSSVVVVVVAVITTVGEEVVGEEEEVDDDDDDEGDDSKFCLLLLLLLLLLRECLRRWIDREDRELSELLGGREETAAATLRWWLLRCCCCCCCCCCGVELVGFCSIRSARWCVCYYWVSSSRVCRGSTLLADLYCCLFWGDAMIFVCGVVGFVLLRSPNFRRRPVWAQLEKKKWFVSDRPVSDRWLLLLLLLLTLLGFCWWNGLCTEIPRFLPFCPTSRAQNCSNGSRDTSSRNRIEWVLNTGQNTTASNHRKTWCRIIARTAAATVTVSSRNSSKNHNNSNWWIKRFEQRNWEGEDKRATRKRDIEYWGERMKSSSLSSENEMLYVRQNDGIHEWELNSKRKHSELIVQSITDVIGSIKNVT